MSFIAWLGERFVFAARMAGVAVFAGGALGGFLSASVCRAFRSTESGDLPPLANAICGSFLGFGTVCLETAVAVGLFVAVTAWRRSRSDPESSFEDAWPEEGRRAGPADVQPAHGAWLLVPAFILIATVVTTWLAGSPAVRFLVQNFTPLSQGLDGLVLMPPGFMLGAVGTLLLAELGRAAGSSRIRTSSSPSPIWV